MREWFNEISKKYSRNLTVWKRWCKW